MKLLVWCGCVEGYDGKGINWICIILYGYGMMLWNGLIIVYFVCNDVMYFKEFII